MYLSKDAFDSSFNAMTAMQDQTEKLVLSFLEKAPWFSDEGKKGINEWVKTDKKGREDFKSAADESFRNVTGCVAFAEVKRTKVDMA